MARHAKRLLRLHALSFLLALGVIEICLCFQVQATLESRHNKLIRPLFASQKGKEVEDEPRDFFVIDWDGCLADTRAWRVSCALSVAKSAWPFLDDALVGDSTWLENKLTALSHIFYSEGQASLTCEYALATRLLIEEQKLDSGRSNGSSGKYASKFHPQSPSRRGSSDATGSRPLTVGEIAANWCDGGMIRDALLTRYHCNQKYPLPFLQMMLDRHLCANWGVTSPQLLPEIQQELVQRRNHTFIVLVQHRSDLAAATTSLALARLQCRVVPSLRDVELGGISVLVQNDTTIRDILNASPVGSNVYVLSSCWDTLKRQSSLFGDDMPKQQGLGRTPYGSFLCLGYVQWAPNTHPTFHVAATMNPWTRLVTLQDLEELLSFRMIR